MPHIYKEVEDLGVDFGDFGDEALLVGHQHISQVRTRITFCFLHCLGPSGQLGLLYSSLQGVHGCGRLRPFVDLRLGHQRDNLVEVSLEDVGHLAWIRENESDLLDGESFEEYL